MLDDFIKFELIDIEADSAVQSGSILSASEQLTGTSICGEDLSLLSKCMLQLVATHLVLVK